MPFGLKGSIIMRSVLQNSSHPIPLSVHRMESGGVQIRWAPSPPTWGQLRQKNSIRWIKSHQNGRRKEKGKGQRKGNCAGKTKTEGFSLRFLLSNYQSLSSTCMPKDANATAAQQHSPSRIGFPPFLIRLTKLVLSPIAAIAMVIRNFPKLTIGLLTAAGILVMVLTTAAIRKKRINHGKILASLKLPLAFCFSLRERYKASTKVMGMIAKVRVSLTMVASVSAVSLPAALLQVVAAATTEEVSFTAVPAHMPNP